MADLRDLMARYQDGDANAFRTLYAEVSPRLLGYLMKMARSRAVADDLLQQTFLKVHRARAAYIRGTDPLPWIYSIAHRTFIDEARKKKRAIVNVATDAEGTVPDVPATITGDAVGATDEPVDSEEAKAALDALAQLPDAQREAVVLTKLEGKSVAEAAEIAGTTIGAMKVRAHRGYEALRKLLGSGTATKAAKKAAAGIVTLSLCVPLAISMTVAFTGLVRRSRSSQMERRGAEEAENAEVGLDPVRDRAIRARARSTQWLVPESIVPLRPLPSLRLCVPSGREARGG
jgi:RNA polymerase sigma-70 factor, ECF subfamily